MPIPDLSALLAPWPGVVVLIMSVRVEFEFIWTYKIRTTATQSDICSDNVTP